MTPARRLLPDPGLPAAALVHAALLAWLASVAVQQLTETPGVLEQSVDVELQTLEQFEALMRPPPLRPPPPPAASFPESALPAPAPPATPAAPEPALPQSDGMIRPRRLLSQQVLANALSRDALAMLPRLAPDERAEQLCGVEAMSQIHAWQSRYEPDRVTAYALAKTRFSGRELQAQGAAFRSRQRWYALSFTCSLSADLKRVSAFAFQVGEPIAPSRWEALGLPAVH
ncbi:DUF930 domain-containing protein [Bosea sp. BH3]|uniref:DUF930 domain-containing protein n=1 Tax=Bosea sp. BH3 TaxID=2871701 RepID=UPI0021CB3170|nr:DUF930 domain-containing protein [Bosea sp. BH3]